LRRVKTGSGGLAVYRREERKGERKRVEEGWGAPEKQFNEFPSLVVGTLGGRREGLGPGAKRKKGTP